jgi:F420-dependent oxidoreductase-like protein
MIRSGLQIPNFTDPDVAPEDLFEAVASVAVTAERSGFDTVLVMDHFYQLPVIGPPDLAMFEAYTLLGALAARTASARLGTLVTGVTYRNPAILAKIVTTLDVVSGGRALLGIGAAWYEAEHDALGVEFPPVAQRFEMLEEAIGICRAMFRGERPTVEGRHYRVRDAVNSPAPLTPGGPPLLIGGQGERKTLRLMAQHAEMANLIASYDDLPRKLDVLAGHCADAGRRVEDINTTALISLIVGSTTAEAEERRDAWLAQRGQPRWADLDERTRATIEGRVVCGDADRVAERCQAFLDLGLDGLVVNLPANGTDLKAVALAGAILHALT